MQQRRQSVTIAALRCVKRDLIRTGVHWYRKWVARPLFGFRPPTAFGLVYPRIPPSVTKLCYYSGMATPSNTVELPLTLKLTKETRQKLDERAAASGTDVAGYVSTIVEQNTSQPHSLEEISGPIYQRFLDSGLTDDQLSDLLEREKHDARAQRRAGRGS